MGIFDSFLEKAKLLDEEETADFSKTVAPGTASQGENRESRERFLRSLSTDAIAELAKTGGYKSLYVLTENSFSADWNSLLGGLIIPAKRCFVNITGPLTLTGISEVAEKVEAALPDGTEIFIGNLHDGEKEEVQVIVELAS